MEYMDPPQGYVGQLLEENKFLRQKLNEMVPAKCKSCSKYLSVETGIVCIGLDTTVPENFNCKKFERK